MTKFIHEDLTHLLIDETVEVNVDGRRHYKSANGCYPSITTVLGHQTKGWLQEWRARVGAEEANRIGRQAAANGNKVHSMAEDYLNNAYTLPDDEMPFYKVAFEALSTALEPVTKVHAQEVKLYSDFLKVAGRCDAVLEYDGKISIVDFKTSKREKDYRQLQNYFVQACAYAIMWEERTGMAINDLVIISINAGSHKPQVTKERRNRWWPFLKGYIQDYYDYYGHIKN